MTQPTIYELALELARTDGWRNVTRGPLFKLCKARGLVGDDCAEKYWCGNNFRGANSLSCIRTRLSAEPDLLQGVPRGEKSPAWKEVNQGLILDKAYDLVVAKRRLMISRAVIAEAAGVSPATVSGMWGGMDALRLAVVNRARAEGRKWVVDQADALGLTG